LTGRVVIGEDVENIIQSCCKVVRYGVEKAQRGIMDLYRQKSTNFSQVEESIITRDYCQARRAASLLKLMRRHGCFHSLRKGGRNAARIFCKVNTAGILMHLRQRICRSGSYDQ
jgi:ATP-dependent protease Clp ATPase subunit